MPYHALYEMLVLYSSKGVQAYTGSIDRPGLGKYRLKMQAAYFKDPNRYYGLGNESVRDPKIEATGINESPFRFYGMNLFLRRNLVGHLQLVGALESRRYLVDALPGSLVVQEQPSGIEGNLVNQFGIALFRDTRDNESNPSRGNFYELSLRVAPPGINVHSYVGASFISRNHFSLGRDITLAGRFVLDGLFGDAPFTVQDKFGLDGTYSIGGGRSLRGYPEGRYIGKLKTLVNLEARALPFSSTIRGLHFDFGAAAFLDTGRVLKDISTSLNGLNLHSGIGAGLRILYEKDFVVRFDMAHSKEDTLRFYLDVGHIF
jgi:outer membrane protein assembly factor BamA